MPICTQQHRVKCGTYNTCSVVKVNCGFKDRPPLELYSFQSVIFLFIYLYIILLSLAMVVDTGRSDKYNTCKFINEYELTSILNIGAGLNVMFLILMFNVFFQGRYCEMSIKKLGSLG